MTTKKMVLVKTRKPIKYGETPGEEKPYGIGVKLSVDLDTYKANKNLFELLEKDAMPAPQVDPAVKTLTAENEKLAAENAEISKAHKELIDVYSEQEKELAELRTEKAKADRIAVLGKLHEDDLRDMAKSQKIAKAEELSREELIDALIAKEVK